jgi:multisubunit Na+/H+ antiporter MnhC subunit
MARRRVGNHPAVTARADVGRAVTLAVLVIVTALALRGHLPGIDRSPPERDADDPAASAFVIALLVVSIAIVAFAVIGRVRNGSAAAAASSDRSDWMRRGGKRASWRLLLLAFAVVTAWLLAIMVLTRWGAGVAVGPPNAPHGATPTTRPAPTPATATAVPPRPGEPPGHPDLFGPFLVATVAFLLLLVVGTIVAARRRRPAVLATPYDDPRTDASDVGSDSLVRAAEVGLAKVGDLSREPRKAIIACYAAMEGELSNVPDVMPQDFDTASEVLARAVAHRALGPGSATQLVDLFDEARFSPHVMTEAHRDVAVRVLQQVLGELRSTS